jgi:hypothetical protein
LCAILLIGRSDMQSEKMAQWIHGRMDRIPSRQFGRCSAFASTGFHSNSARSGGHLRW